MGVSPWEGEGDNASPVLYVGADCFAADRIEGTIAHEFMHCIQARYDVIFAEPDDIIREPWANYAGILYCESVGKLGANISDMQTGIAAYFYDTQTSLLKYVASEPQKYKYACILLPLLLHQYYGGVTTNRDVLEELFSIRTYISITGGTPSVDDIFEAIDMVVSDIYFDGTYQSVRDVFENFGLYNYNYSNRYTWFQNQSWTSNVSVNEDILSRSSLSYDKLERIGYGYYRLSSSPSTVQITLDLYKIYGDYDNCTCYIAEVNSAGSITNLTKIRMTSDLLNLNYTFSSTANNLCIFVDNLSTVSGDLSVSLTVN